MNKGYLYSSNCPVSDECFTPRYAVLPIIKYLKAKGYKNIWCPFDKKSSMFVRVLESNGFNVTYTHLDYRQDFFVIDMPQGVDCVVSNPPFSKKDNVLKRLYEMRIPFAIILPQNSLQSIVRVDMFLNYGLEYLGFDRRINYYTRGELEAWKPANHFASGYFCNNVLPEKLLFEKLTPVQEKYDIIL